MARLSIRMRLTIWYSAVLLVGLIVFGGVMWFALGERLMAGVDGRLSQRVDGLRTVVEIEGAARDPDKLQEELSEFVREVPEGALIELRDSHGRVFLPSPGSRISAIGKPGFDTQVRDGHALRTLSAHLVVNGSGYDALVVESLDEIAEVMRAVRRLLLMMVPAVLAAAWFGGYWISRRALKPVDEITDVARSISAENLSRRLDVPSTGDELQRMAETWNEVLERLDSALKRIRQFTADASHELRTPIALISATSELALRRERLPEEYRQSLHSIHLEAGRMTRLAEELLTLARADSAGGHRMTLAPTDLNGVVEQIVGEMWPAAAAKQVSLVAQTAPGATAVRANDAGIRRLLRALIENAIAHTPAAGRVTVSTAPYDGGVRLSVEDTGEGIPPDALPHIFERFFRVDAARGNASGAGLGLSIAQTIANAHGSRIEADSSPGVGSRFQLILPDGT